MTSKCLLSVFHILLLIYQGGRIKKRAYLTTYQKSITEKPSLPAKKIRLYAYPLKKL